MRRQDHSPAYVLQIKRQWRVWFQSAGNSPQGYAPQSFPPVRVPRHGFGALRGANGRCAPKPLLTLGSGRLTASGHQIRIRSTSSKLTSSCHPS